jgi:pimeloyl-ACP methyl ester carboxylesterase
MKNETILLCLLVVLSANANSWEVEPQDGLKVDSGYVQVDGGKMFYEIAGKGEHVVLLHDGILHREIWDAQFQVLAKSYRVVRYDRRGFGRSSAPQAPFSHLDDLHTLFAQLKIDRATVFGMSAGGGLAINFALQYPEKVRALVLVGAVVGGYGYSNHFLTRGGHITSLADYREPEKFIQYFGWEDPYEVYPENMKAKERFFSLLKANPSNVTGALGYFAKPFDKPAVKHLSEIGVPALVLVGEYDIPDVHAHAGVIEVGIPQARREIIPKSGHLIPLEQPDAFNASVMRFLQSVEFKNALHSQGINAAVRYFHERRNVQPGIVLFEEREMNDLGYRYLQAGNVGDAIEIFKLNTIAYPKSANTFDSLGEAYMKNGDTELAIENYKKSLELNPQNDNAKRMLEQLENNR